ncbi:hypothetical protein [Actinophytocola gossypii]|uniref:Uncharacterized protein n=1 Tax=Actinophytocola gossypii TaxID=2812003 RepID=A0ABT2JGS2_9PSEU|nr:hypothetical protein [Actinophytocola gossypii]MCT2587069.1 hypothetical protein [Actinophytocola gossypii]
MGYSYDPEALNKVAAGNSAAADSIDTGLAVRIPSADAGMSSEIVGLTVANLVLLGVTLAQTFDEISARVDATDGSYAEVENTNEGRMTYVARYHTNPGYHAPVGPLERAPVRNTEATP